MAEEAAPLLYPLVPLPAYVDTMPFDSRRMTLLPVCCIEGGRVAGWSEGDQWSHVATTVTQAGQECPSAPCIRPLAVMPATPVLATHTRPPPHPPPLHLTSEPQLSCLQPPPLHLAPDPFL